jgi:hypothetical protein
LRKIINTQSEKILDGSSNQYLIFQPVTTKDLAEIDRERDVIGRHARLTHCTETQTLVIKLMPSLTYEVAHRAFGRKIERMTDAMGMSKYDLCPLGAGKFEVPGRTAKEGDSCYRPAARKRDG